MCIIMFSHMLTNYVQQTLRITLSVIWEMSFIGELCYFTSNSLCHDNYNIHEKYIAKWSLKKCSSCMATCQPVQGGIYDEGIETDMVGHVPCSTLPQKDYNIDLRDTVKDMCWTRQPDFISVLAYPYS